MMVVSLLSDDLQSGGARSPYFLWKLAIDTVLRPEENLVKLGGGVRRSLSTFPLA